MSSRFSWNICFLLGTGLEAWGWEKRALTKDYPVYFIEEPLLIKRGGHSDQLSQKFWGIDRFRIQALEKLLQTGDVTPEQKEQTLQELRRKCQIIASGCFKRQKFEEWKHYNQLPQKYFCTTHY